MFAALLGLTVAVNIILFPFTMLIVLEFNVTPLTFIGVTVTKHVAFLLPSSVVTVIVVVPTDFAVTTPELDTVATLVLLLVHVTFLFAALLGDTVAVNVLILPFTMLIVLELKVTPLTLIGVTVTSHVAFLLPSSVVTVIVAVPTDFAVITPVEDTVATLVLLLVHVTFLFSASLGDTAAFKDTVIPFTTVTDL